MRNPWALLALAAAILPWFFVRARTPENPRKIAFPALVLLTSATKNRKARKRRRVLLAATRSAALVALALVWAEPFLNGEKKETSSIAQSLENQEFDANKKNRVENGTLDGRPIRVLIVDGTDSGEPRFNKKIAAKPTRPSAAFYWAAALNPTFDAASSETLQLEQTQRFPKVEVVTSTDFSLLSSAELQAFDALLFVDVSAPTSAELEKIQRFLKSGAKTFVVCAGPRIRLERWNEIWRRFNISAQTFDVDLSAPNGEARQTVVANALQSVANNDVAENAFRELFAKTANSGIDALPIWRAFPTLGPDVVPTLRDRETRLPTVAKISAPEIGDSLFWVATVPDERVGALAFAPNFVPLASRIVEFALLDALGETPSNAVVTSTVENARLKARWQNAGTLALWAALAFCVAAEFVLTFSENAPKRRRLTI